MIINNAAGNFVCPSERLSPNAWRSVTDIVLNGTAFVTLELGRRLIQAQKGGGGGCAVAPRQRVIGACGCRGVLPGHRHHLRRVRLRFRGSERVGEGGGGGHVQVGPASGSPAAVVMVTALLLASLRRSLAAEWGRYGHRFNVIHPGPIRTKVAPS